VFDYIPFPVFTHTTGMTHFKVAASVLTKEKKYRPQYCETRTRIHGVITNMNRNRRENLEEFKRFIRQNFSDHGQVRTVATKYVNYLAL